MKLGQKREKAEKTSEAGASSSSSRSTETSGAGGAQRGSYQGGGAPALPPFSLSLSHHPTPVSYLASSVFRLSFGPYLLRRFFSSCLLSLLIWPSLSRRTRLPSHKPILERRHRRKSLDFARISQQDKRLVFKFLLKEFQEGASNNSLDQAHHFNIHNIVN